MLRCGFVFYYYYYYYYLKIKKKSEPQSPCYGAVLCSGFRLVGSGFALARVSVRVAVSKFAFCGFAFCGSQEATVACGNQSTMKVQRFGFPHAAVPFFWGPPVPRSPGPPVPRSRQAYSALYGTLTTFCTLFYGLFCT